MLVMPVSEWEDQGTYRQMKSKLATFVVNNDSAERRVKLAHDRVDSATIEERCQNISQVVEKNGAAAPESEITTEIYDE